MTIDVVFGTLAIHVIAEPPDVDPPSLRGSFRHTRLRLHGAGRKNAHHDQHEHEATGHVTPFHADEQSLLNACLAAAAAIGLQPRGAMSIKALTFVRGTVVAGFHARTSLYRNGGRLMSSRSKWGVLVGVCFVLLTGGEGLRAQARFEAVTRDAVDAVPGLQVITIRDRALNACYTLFVIEAAKQVPPLPPLEMLSPDEAAAERDGRLSQLIAALEQSSSVAVPGTLGPNILQYEWEAQKAQSEFERALREAEVARLEAPLKRIADAPHFAVSGPAPCGGASASQEKKR